MFVKMADRTIAQEVSRWFPTAAARVRVQSGHVGFVVDKVALGQVFSEYFGFPCQSLFHQILHPHNHQVQVQKANWWPMCRVDPVGLQPPLIELKKNLKWLIHCIHIMVDTVHCLKKVSVYIFVPYDISSVGPNPIF
jgi:hypothetical protein